MTERDPLHADLPAPSPSSPSPSAGGDAGGADRPSAAETIATGQLVPHFTVADLDGRTRRYVDLWQHRLLVLVLLPEGESAASRAYADSLADIVPALDELQATLIVSTAAIPGLAPPAFLVADRWGEVHHVQQGSGDDPRADVLPAPEELVQWVQYVASRCG